MPESKTRKKDRTRQITALTAAILILAAAITVFVFRKDIGELIGAGTAAADNAAAWTYETGYSQVFAAAGNGLAAASSTGIQLIDADGNTIVRHVCSLESPALAASEKLVAAYDVGGTALRIADFEGNITEMDTDDAIISVTMNEEGFIAVTTFAAGYKGVVMVYGPELEPIFEWYSGEGYPLSARVSPDGNSMAALTAAEDGGHIHIFSLSSSDEKASYIAQNELLFDLCWMDSSRICAISEKEAVFVKDTGELVGAYDFGGMYISDYSFGGSGFITLALSKYLSANASVIVTVGDGGEALGQTETDSELKYLSASGKRVLALFSDELVLYTQSLKRDDTAEDLQGVRQALIRPKGDVVMIFAAYAQIESF